MPHVLTPIRSASATPFNPSDLHLKLHILADNKAELLKALAHLTQAIDDSPNGELQLNTSSAGNTISAFSSIRDGHTR